MNIKKIKPIIKFSLQEDIGHKDLTASLIPKTTKAKAIIVCKQKTAIICGCKLVTLIFTQIDPTIKIKWLVQDGDFIKKGQILCTINGNARNLLSAERTALNFLQILSSNATLTKKFSKLLEGTKAQLLDTRKTLPGLRIAQKYAVLCGGGYNHRFGLYDSILIKENHIAIYGSISKIINKAKILYPNKKIEIEVTNLDELKEAIEATPDVIMLDNFDIENIRRAVNINKNRIKLEVSGGINKNNIKKIAQTGVDYISVGAITKIITPIELSMLIYYK